ncbi:hypothetical protein CLIB1444_02S14444 [[Candida] jaroonii]|uniref:Uncharacterized protein n=1 Tax=[Candida] jaroonii TaxID=467808 RepID=A0ACA9Y435_9ASCO|nr:hypothetical protein CLIB1444_02S14444 [[Candida] jaroonii]
MNDDFEKIKELMKDSMSSIFNVTSDSFTEFKQIMDNDKIFSFDYFFEDGRPVSTGLKSHKPSVRKYNECLDKKGLSVWDSKGYWRCLFPQAIIPKGVNGVLTKEVFEDSIRDKSYDGKYDLGEKGIYFKNFEDLMNWKASMFKVAKEQRPQIVWDEKFNQWNDRCKKWTNKMNEKLEQVSLEKDKRVEKYVDKYTDKYGDNNVGNVKTDVVPIPEGKTVVSTDIQTIWINDDKESSYKETRTEYYSDGTSKTNTISRTSPPEKKGWFWN